MSIRFHRSRALLVTMLSVLPFPMADWFLSRFTAAWAAEDAARTELETVKKLAREAVAESAALRQAIANTGHAAHAAGQGELAHVLFGALKFDDSHGRRLLEEMTEILAARNGAEARADEHRARHTKLWDDVCDALAAGEHEEPVVAAKRVKAELAELLAADDASATITVQRDRARASDLAMRTWIEERAEALDDDALEDQAREWRAFLASVSDQGAGLLRDFERELDASRTRATTAEARAAKLAAMSHEAATSLERLAKELDDYGAGPHVMSSDACELATKLREAAPRPTRLEIIEKAARACVANESATREAICVAANNDLGRAGYEPSRGWELDAVIQAYLMPSVYVGEMGREVEYRLKAKV